MGIFNSSQANLGSKFVRFLIQQNNRDPAAALEALIGGVSARNKEYRLAMLLSNEGKVLSAKYTNTSGLADSLDTVVETLADFGFVKEEDLDTNPLTGKYNGNGGFVLEIGEDNVKVTQRRTKAHDKQTFMAYLSKFRGIVDYLAGNSNKIPGDFTRPWLAARLNDLIQGYDLISWNGIGHHRTVHVRANKAYVSDSYDHPILTVKREKKYTTLTATASGNQIEKLLDEKFDRKGSGEFWNGKVMIGRKQYTAQAIILEDRLILEVYYKTKTGQDAKPVVEAVYNHLFN